MISYLVVDENGTQHIQTRGSDHTLCGVDAHSMRMEAPSSRLCTDCVQADTQTWAKGTSNRDRKKLRDRFGPRGHVMGNGIVSYGLITHTKQCAEASYTVLLT